MLRKLIPQRFSTAPGLSSVPHVVKVAVQVAGTYAQSAMLENHEEECWKEMAKDVG